jgi:hypothetical protein
MRPIVALIAVALACGGAPQNLSAPAPPEGTPSSTAPDAGSPSVAAKSDAGPPPVASQPAPDAGAPSLPEIPCAAPAQVLWSRSLPDSSQVDFRGTADADGNLYWVEYAQAPTDANPHPPASLVSVTLTGQDRYRVPLAVAGGEFLFIQGRIVTTQGATVSAQDASTGADLWTLDLTPYISTGDATGAVSGGMTDLGAGKVGLALANPPFGGFFVIDSASGTLTANKVGQPNPRLRILGSDKAGSALLTANGLSFSPFSVDTIEVYRMDSSANVTWAELIENFDGLALWNADDVPWLSVLGASGISSNGNHLTVPPRWFGGVAAADGVFIFDESFVPTQGVPGLPLAMHFVRGQTVAATAFIQEVQTFDGAQAHSFAAGDHADFVAQPFHAQAGLCHPDTAGTAYLGRVDASSFQVCPLPFTGDSRIAVAAPAGPMVVVGRYVTLDESCNVNQVAPFVIEMYARP